MALPVAVMLVINWTENSPMVTTGSKPTTWEAGFAAKTVIGQRRRLLLPRGLTTEAGRAPSQSKAPRHRRTGGVFTPLLGRRSCTLADAAVGLGNVRGPVLDYNHDFSLLRSLTDSRLRFALLTERGDCAASGFSLSPTLAMVPCIVQATNSPPSTHGQGIRAPRLLYTQADQD